MLKTKLISGLIGITTATLSIVGCATEAIAASLYLTPGETSTVTGSYEAWASGQERAIIEWYFYDFYWGALQFVEDSLFEVSRDGTKYAITNDAISRLGPRENAKISYRPFSAQDTPGGETTADLVDWSRGSRFSMEVGVRTLDLDALFAFVKQSENYPWGPAITSIQDMHNLYLGEVYTTFLIGGHRSSGSRDIYLDLSNYNPPTEDNSQNIPEPGTVIALVALMIGGLTSVKKNSHST